MQYSSLALLAVPALVSGSPVPGLNPISLYRPEIKVALYYQDSFLHFCTINGPGQCCEAIPQGKTVKSGARDFYGNPQNRNLNQAFVNSLPRGFVVNVHKVPLLVNTKGKVRSGCKVQGVPTPLNVAAIPDLQQEVGQRVLPQGNWATEHSDQAIPVYLEPGQVFTGITIDGPWKTWGQLAGETGENFKTLGSTVADASKDWWNKGKATTTTWANKLKSKTGTKKAAGGSSSEAPNAPVEYESVPQADPALGTAATVQTQDPSSEIVPAVETPEDRELAQLAEAQKTPSKSWKTWRSSPFQGKSMKDLTGLMGFGKSPSKSPPPQDAPLPATAAGPSTPPPQAGPNAAAVPQTPPPQEAPSSGTVDDSPIFDETLWQEAESPEGGPDEMEGTIPPTGGKSDQVKIVPESVPESVPRKRVTWAPDVDFRDGGRRLWEEKASPAPDDIPDAAPSSQFTAEELGSDNNPGPSVYLKASATLDFQNLHRRPPVSSYSSSDLAAPGAVLAVVDVRNSESTVCGQMDNTSGYSLGYSFWNTVLPRFEYCLGEDDCVLRAIIPEGRLPVRADRQ
ncbi:MAG: hypothetical protein M1825_001803 [Sarcosagium campestre]|nr:MAG: hypothetical protein M1825_001803 [Sarcosagium campestre]